MPAGALRAMHVSLFWQQVVTNPNAPQLYGIAEIRLESAERASGYWTTRADKNPEVDERTVGAYWRAHPEDMTILDGPDNRKRAELIAERLAHWKSIKNA